MLVQQLAALGQTAEVWQGQVAQYQLDELETEDGERGQLGGGGGGRHKKHYKKRGKSGQQSEGQIQEVNNNTPCSMQTLSPVFTPVHRSITS